MLIVYLIIIFLSVFTVIMVLGPLFLKEERPTLMDLEIGTLQTKKTKESFFRQAAQVNKPFIPAAESQRLNREFSIAYVDFTPEEFFLIKEIVTILALLTVVFLFPQDMKIFGLFFAVIVGLKGPDFWLKNKIKRVKAVIVKELPDVVDLLGLCVNAGLDFMLSLKWVVERSPPSVMIDQLNTLLQEINVGKPRRDALRDMARRFDLPDLSTFSRTLIMADKMGTSMSDALNSLSIDMRYARYRRGEAMALKAPLKLLIPLIFCIFPVVLLLVAGPLFLQFMKLEVIQAPSVQRGEGVPK